MTTPRLALALTLLLALSACKTAPGQARLRTTSAGLPAAAAPTPSPAQKATIGLLGIAEAPSGVLANAELKVYKPGSTTSIATGKTRADGAFVVDLGGKQIPDGGLLKVVATGAGGSLAGIVAAGGLHLIGNDGGTLTAPGGLDVKPSLIGNDGSTLIGNDGSTMVAAGGGNLVAAGGGNYRLLAAPPRGEVRLSVATTIAVAVLGKRLDGALGAAYKGDQAIDGAVDQVMAAYDRFAAASQKSLEAGGADALIERVLKGSFDGGAIDLPADVASGLAALSGDLRTAFVDAATALGEAIATAARAGGQVAGGTDAASFGDAQAGAVTVPQPDPATPDRPDPGTSGGGDAGADEGGFGEDGAEDEGDPDESDGTITIHGDYDPPAPPISAP